MTGRRSFGLSMTETIPWALQKRHTGDTRATPGRQLESQKSRYMDQCTFGAVRTS